MDQKSDFFETPPFEAIPEITRQHVAAMEASQSPSDPAWVAANMPHLLLRTIGRRSGAPRKAALPYWLDDDQQIIVVGSYAGADKHPAWYLNLCDRAANPEPYIKTRDGGFWARAEILEPPDHARIWEQLIRDRPFYADYQAGTARKIPLVRLVKLRSCPTPPE